MARMSSKRAERAIDQQIERAYYRHAQGYSIPIFDISKLYRDARVALAAGGDLDAVMPELVSRYCQPV